MECSVTAWQFGHDEQVVNNNVELYFNLVFYLFLYILKGINK